jgi:hypothetical protein
MTAYSAPAPTSQREARVVLLYLASLAARPLEDEDTSEWVDGVAWTERPAIALRLSRVAEDWTTYSASIRVRDALGRARARRSLGPRGFLKAVRTISTSSRNWNNERRQATVEEYDRIRLAEYAAAAAARRKPDSGYLREARESVERPLWDLPDNDCPISWRQNGSTDHVRLRRDFGGDGGDLWTDLVQRYEDEENLLDFADVLAGAEVVGFDTTSPLPASWVIRVEADQWDDDEWDDDEDQDDTPAVVLRAVPSPTPPPASSGRWTCALCGTASAWQSRNSPPINPCPCGSTAYDGH